MSASNHKKNQFTHSKILLLARNLRFNFLHWKNLVKLLEKNIQYLKIEVLSKVGNFSSRQPTPKSLKIQKLLFLFLKSQFLFISIDLNNSWKPLSFINEQRQHHHHYHRIRCVYRVCLLSFFLSYCCCCQDRFQRIDWVEPNFLFFFILCFFFVCSLFIVSK